MDGEVEAHGHYNRTDQFRHTVLSWGTAFDHDWNVSDEPVPAWSFRV